MEQALRLIAEAKRTKATSLDLSDCGLTWLPDELFELEELEELDLSIDVVGYDAKVFDFDSLGELPNLQAISLKGLIIRDFTPLLRFPRLKSLDVSRSLHIDLTSLQCLVNLEELNVSNSQISDLIFLKCLTSLITLDVSENQISDLTPLNALSKLRRLRLSNTDVSDLSPIQSLRSLELIDVTLSEVSDLRPLKDLKKLQVLDAQLSQVSDLSPLQGLTNLKELYISDTQIIDLNPLRDLTNLKELNISKTSVSDLSPLIGLDNLQELYVQETKVSSLSSLRSLKNLQLLDVSNTQVCDLYPLRGLLARINIFWSSYSSWEEPGIYVENCPIDEVLIAAIKQGHDSVQRYFEKKTVPLYEARVLILGEPRAGKTTLRRKLKSVDGPMPTVFESTKAFEVEVEPYKCQIIRDGAKKKLTYHLWDFGGQDYYRLLHQLFVAEQSVYVIVTDTDRNKNEEEIDFWLETIQRLGKDKDGKYGPVLLLQNPKTKREGNDFTDLKKRYTFWQQQEQFVINLNALSEKTEGFDRRELEAFRRFKAALERSFCELVHVGKQMPAEWVKVRKELLKHEGKNWITTEAFYEICIKKGISDLDEMNDLLGIFHTLGYVQYYKDTTLKGIVILKREWVTDALYRVLDDKIVHANKGWFLQQDVENIWSEPQYRNRTAELLALMQEFKLSYYNSDNQKHIVPAKLPEDTEGLPEWNNEHNVRLHLVYDWMPKAVPLQLMVSLHDYLVELEGGEQWIWRKGAVLDGKKLDLKDVQVRILENWKENRIEISARGEYSEVLIRTVMAAWRKVNEPFEGKVTVSKEILCNCEKCQVVSRPFVYDYEDVLNAVNAKGKLQCNKSRLSFAASEILKGVFDEITVKLDALDRGGKGLTIELRDLISSNKIKEALDKAMQLSDDNFVLVLINRLSRIESDYLNDLVPREQYNLEVNRIIASFLAYIDTKRRDTRI